MHDLRALCRRDPGWCRSLSDNRVSVPCDLVQRKPTRRPPKGSISSWPNSGLTRSPSASSPLSATPLSEIRRAAFSVTPRVRRDGPRFCAEKRGRAGALSQHPMQERQATLRWPAADLFSGPLRNGLQVQFQPVFAEVELGRLGFAAVREDGFHPLIARFAVCALIPDEIHGRTRLDAAADVEVTPFALVLVRPGFRSRRKLVVLVAVNENSRQGRRGERIPFPAMPKASATIPVRAL